MENVEHNLIASSQRAAAFVDVVAVISITLVWSPTCDVSEVYVYYIALYVLSRMVSAHWLRAWLKGR